MDIKKDGWVNSLTALGGTRDKKTYTKFQLNRLLDRAELSEMYVSDGLVSKVVNTIPDDMVKQGIYYFANKSIAQKDHK